MKHADVVIIGAGISGLIAAIELEKNGINPLILEASDVPGGRLKTDRYEGFLLDHGFQVLLTAYPEARHYLDYESLNLARFEPGADVYTGDTVYQLTDPLRNPGKMLQMLFSGIGSFGDKLTLARFIKDLRNDDPADIFSGKSGSTIDYLRNRGFSEKIIEYFFRPFFSGIFLETDLSTSSRLFEFVFKMFSEGFAALPANGIQAIPKQLISGLSQTEIRYNVRAEEVTHKGILTSDGEYRAGDVIITTYPHHLLPGLRDQKQYFHRVLNLYFRVQEPVIGRPRLGLTTGNRLINNFCYPTQLHSGMSASQSHLLSVSIVDVPDTDLTAIISQVKAEWKELTGQEGSALDFIKEYDISHALPKVDLTAYNMPHTAVKIQDHVFVAGDYLLYGSLNAAMTSGRTAAQAVIAGRGVR